MSDLAVQNIHLSFNGRLILTDVAMACRKGELVSIIGQSAEGKSSLLKIIYGTRRADHQEIYLEGKMLTKAYLQTNKLHFVPAGFFIPGYLRLDTIANIFDWETEHIGVLRELATIEKTRIYALSNSQRKLVELLSILYTPGDFVLMDEPYTMLEKTEENLFNRLLQKANLKKGVIMTFRPHQQVPTQTDHLYELVKGHLIKIEDWGEKKELSNVNFT